MRSGASLPRSPPTVIATQPMSHEPASADRVRSVVLPHDWLTWRLSGGVGRATTDRGDASGTGYWSPAQGSYRHDLLELALGHRLAMFAGDVGEFGVGLQRFEALLFAVEVDEVEYTGLQHRGLGHAGAHHPRRGRPAGAA